MIPLGYVKYYYLLVFDVENVSDGVVAGVVDIDHPSTRIIMNYNDEYCPQYKVGIEHATYYGRER